ncbi:hypothetical protein CPB84DRAFT_1747853 [Gymnopilus junonius]|uniref:Uncharacterized protein n=1 Tax=Gymnopilus junonius TaxID=109634 RepID=A0A9P5TN84_GYMJU|nr:hypothetical protein CPB84DRAFT_1747853 [Gymnopilus junonius]
MYVAADRIDQALEARPSHSEKVKFARSHPEFLRAGIKFLTLNQNVEDWMAMMEYLTHSRCTFNRPWKTPHFSNRSRPTGRVIFQVAGYVYDVVSTISTCLILAISNLTQDKFYNGTTTSGKKLWPQNSEDLLPFGSTATIAGLRLWLSTPAEGHVIYKLAVRLALYHAPFSREIFDVDLVMTTTSTHLVFASTYCQIQAVRNPSDDLQTRARINHSFTQPVIAE